ncbi:Ada metal-binding domain-containing protein [Catalinimonas sp. 4WD22]|uniref:Ada metal-binding domain-containing protein n=1 Tax=Catalinimonas locisalis TaxID=3133978 RepID=UPI003100E1B5
MSDREVRKMIRAGMIQWSGNRKLRIFGGLHCKSGKRLRKENRVFFSSREEAEQEDYRPCAHCMKSAYQEWKNGFI